MEQLRKAIEAMDDESCRIRVMELQGRVRETWTRRRVYEWGEECMAVLDEGLAPEAWLVRRREKMKRIAGTIEWVQTEGRGERRKGGKEAKEEEGNEEKWQIRGSSAAEVLWRTRKRLREVEEAYEARQAENRRREATQAGRDSQTAAIVALVLAVVVALLSTIAMRGYMPT